MQALGVMGAGGSFCPALRRSLLFSPHVGTEPIESAPLGARRFGREDSPAALQTLLEIHFSRSKRLASPLEASALQPDMFWQEWASGRRCLRQNFSEHQRQSPITRATGFAHPERLQQVELALALWTGRAVGVLSGELLLRACA